MVKDRERDRETADLTQGVCSLVRVDLTRNKTVQPFNLTPISIYLIFEFFNYKISGPLLAKTAFFNSDIVVLFLVSVVLKYAKCHKYRVKSMPQGDGNKMGAQTDTSNISMVLRMDPKIPVC